MVASFTDESQKKYSKDIAIAVLSETQYYSIKPLLEELRVKKYSFDILIDPKDPDNSGYIDIAGATKKLLNNDGFSPIEIETDSFTKTYKVLISPYPDAVSVIYRYLLGYLYAPMTSKPNPVYLPRHQMHFHGIFCLSTYEKELLTVYSNTYLVANLKYINFTKIIEQNNIKKNLLYLPTYGDISSIDEITKELKQLRKKFKIITKIHHGTAHLYNEENRKNELREVSDEYYEGDISLSDLLQKADVVLSDNSGAIFEAMSVGTPVAIFSQNPNERKLDNLDTMQYKLISKKILPYTSRANRIESIINRALSEDIILKQRTAATSLFPKVETGVQSWIEVINEYLLDNVNQDYIQLHNFYVDENMKNIIEIQNNQSTIDQLSEQQELLKNKLSLHQHTIDTLKQQLNLYKTGKLYKLSSYIYKKIKKLP